MSPVTHCFTGWVFANCVDLGRRDRAFVTLACVAPDVDGLGIIPELITRNSADPLLWFSLYHHSLHNLAFALVVAAIAFALGAEKWKTGLLALLSFHVHLFEDVLGSRRPDGYQWPIPYLAPFSSSLQFVWRGQWGLNTWPNVLITIVLLFITLWLARRKGSSPLEMVLAKVDSALIAALRKRFPARTAVTIDGYTVKLCRDRDFAWIVYREPSGRTLTLEAHDWLAPGNQPEVLVDFPTEISFCDDELPPVKGGTMKLGIPRHTLVAHNQGGGNSCARANFRGAHSRLKIRHEFARPRRSGWTSFEDGREIYHG